jgi:hypothetical protein
MGVSKESFCRLPQLWERVRFEIAKKRTDRILPPHPRIHEPISLHGLRPSFFPFFPYPFLASRLCQISLLIWWIRPVATEQVGVSLPRISSYAFSETGLRKVALRAVDLPN